MRKFLTRENLIQAAICAVIMLVLWWKWQQVLPFYQHLMRIKE